MRTKKSKSRRKNLVAVIDFLSMLLVVLCLMSLGGVTTVYAHSGGTDSNGGHYQHTAACRNSGYKNHTSACTYHYHNGNGSSDSNRSADDGDGWVAAVVIGGIVCALLIIYVVYKKKAK